MPTCSARPSTAPPVSELPTLSRVIIQDLLPLVAGQPAAGELLAKLERLVLLSRSHLIILQRLQEAYLVGVAS